MKNRLKSGPDLTAGKNMVLTGNVEYEIIVRQIVEKIRRHKI